MRIYRRSYRSNQRAWCEVNLVGWGIVTLMCLSMLGAMGSIYLLSLVFERMMS